MAENKVNRDNYISLQGWMITDLGLKGNELIIYACIYGFSQAEDQVFSGSLQYLADWTNSTKQSVMKCLKSLVEKGYIRKSDKLINGVKFCEYHATKFNWVYNKVAQGMQQSFIGGMQQSLPNNLDIDNLEDNLENKDSKGKRKSSESYDSIIEKYTDDMSLRETLGEFVKMRKRIRKPMTSYALTLLTKKLDKMASSSDVKVAILNQSIVNGWQDLYELKNQGRKEVKANAKHVGTGSEYGQQNKDGLYFGEFL